MGISQKRWGSEGQLQNTELKGQAFPVHGNSATHTGVLLKKSRRGFVAVGVHHVSLPQEFVFSQQANSRTMANTQSPVIAEGPSSVYVPQTNIVTDCV